MSNPQNRAEAAVRDYAHVVRRIAQALSRRVPASVEVDDLYQCGMIGLLQAVETFDADAGAEFETFASHRIRGAMIDGLRESDWLPRSVRRHERDMAAARERCEQRNLRAAQSADVAAALGIPLHEYHEQRDAANAGMLYFDDMMSPSGDRIDENVALERMRTYVEIETPLDELVQRERAEAITNASTTLSTQHQRLMFLYYEAGLRFSEIAEEFGVTESRICQIHAIIIKKLRANLLVWDALKPGYKNASLTATREARQLRWKASRVGMSAPEPMLADDGMAETA